MPMRCGDERAQQFGRQLPLVQPRHDGLFVTWSPWGVLRLQFCPVPPPPPLSLEARSPRWDGLTPPRIASAEAIELSAKPENLVGAPFPCRGETALANASTCISRFRPLVYSESQFQPVFPCRLGRHRSGLGGRVVMWEVSELRAQRQPVCQPVRPEPIYQSARAGSGDVQLLCSRRRRVLHDPGHGNRRCRRLHGQSCQSCPPGSGVVSARRNGSRQA